MADEFESYRYEYVSGVVDIFNTDGAFFFVHVTNRGSVEGAARAFILNREGQTIIDSGQAAVPARQTGFLGTQVDDPRLQAGESFHVRIYTSSPDLVPSARAYSLGDPTDEDTPGVTDVYFAPDDFARFDLPFRPGFPTPPVGPNR